MIDAHVSTIQAVLRLCASRFASWRAARRRVSRSRCSLSRMLRPNSPYRVGFLGQPASCEPAWIRPIEWNCENIGKLKSLGFTVIQVDVAWTRPDDEILCIEDVVELTPAEQKELDRGVPGRELMDNTPLLLLHNVCDAYALTWRIHDREFSQPSAWMNGRGTQAYEYALLAHEEDWEAAEVPQWAWEYNTPVIAQAGFSAPAARFCDTSSNVIIESMRRVDDEIEVRLAECLGLGGKGRIQVPSPSHARQANAMRTSTAGYSQYFFGTGRYNRTVRSRVIAFAPVTLRRGGAADVPQRGQQAFLRGLLPAGRRLQVPHTTHGRDVIQRRHGGKWQRLVQLPSLVTERARDNLGGHLSDPEPVFVHQSWPQASNLIAIRESKRHGGPVDIREPVRIDQAAIMMHVLGEVIIAPEHVREPVSQPIGQLLPLHLSVPVSGRTAQSTQGTPGVDHITLRYAVPAEARRHFHIEPRA